MIKFDTGLTVLDISRLWARRDRASPSGIDRVELKTAEDALDHNTLFFISSGPRRWFLAKDQVRSLAQALRERWARSSRDTASGIERIANMIGLADASALLPSDHLPELEPINLTAPGRFEAWRRFRRTDRKIVERAGDLVHYINVSHQHLEKLETLRSLKERWQARVTIYWHDAIPISFPEYAAPHEPERHHQRLVTALRLADTLLVNSKATEQNLRDIADQEGLAVPPVELCPLVSEFPYPDQVPDINTSKPYFVTIGTIEPRKNHLLLLKIWREMAAALGDDCPPLIIIGNRGWLNEGTFAMLDRCRAIRPYVIEVSGLSDQSVAVLLKAARALLFPSFAEGFGLPLLEAQQLGTPVIASDLPVFHEITTSPFQSLSPLDGEAWKKVILQAAKR
ncbi:MAG: glycosyltransferase family 1 protein [Pseudomonadota bacterium]